ncbi:16S rRNA (guanine(966)-N(2))-methyltransferase RsmD [Melaminivora jejuensis]|uniref:16S rRNA (guanine(966)-N(2))-methyltransferase RsmD n=1 Tax=Melaminivora jejuensis TaxID=1267217 RepID=UPI001ADF3255|nr:16S rRNA (guanine(966)-N(2))-methyltransferase RsmD [Melaminivora jejuensis]UHJ65617.1 16S rRNA (guanine(966)-N(2))-methyltransferase RsmD [Melaminivora jejuensis]
MSRAASGRADGQPGKSGKSAGAARIAHPAKTGKTGGAPGAPAPVSGEVRIIGGQWKRTRLPVADKPGLRPTPDRVRETLFNWLGQDLGGWRCLDAFAGTGALGLEAASRGAASVLLVESDAALAAQLRRHVQRLQASQQQVSIRRGDGLQALQGAAAASLELVFIDPPYAQQDSFAPALRSAARALAPGGFIYLEAGQAWEPAALAALGLALHRHLKAGAVHAHLLQAAPDAG